MNFTINIQILQYHTMYQKSEIQTTFVQTLSKFFTLRIFNFHDNQSMVSVKVNRA